MTKTIVWLIIILCLMALIVGSVITRSYFPRVVKVEQPEYDPDTLVSRRIADSLESEIEFLQDHPEMYPKTETLILYRDTLIVDSADAVGSLPVTKRTFRDSIISIDRKRRFDLIVYYRGIFYGYDINWHSSIYYPSPSAKKPFLRLYCGLGGIMDINRTIYGEFEAGILAAERIRLFGRVNPNITSFFAGDSIGIKYYIGAKYEFQTGSR